MPGRRRIMTLSAAGLMALAWLAAAAAQTAPAQDWEAARQTAQGVVVKLLDALTPQQKEDLGLAQATPQNVGLGKPLPVYAAAAADLLPAEARNWGGLFKETDRAFFPVKVAGEETCGVWIRRQGGGFAVTGVGEKSLAQSLAEARDLIGPALAESDLKDPYVLRLVSLDWAASQFLMVLVRDRLFFWPLPTAQKLLGLEIGLYGPEDIAPLLTGRSTG